MFMIQFLQINRSFELVRSDLHLREFQRVAETGPGVPVHAVSIRLLRASQIKTVQVGVVTFSVPPGTIADLRTTMMSEVLVISAEILTYMVRE